MAGWQVSLFGNQISQNRNANGHNCLPAVSQVSREVWASTEGREKHQPWEQSWAWRPGSRETQQWGPGSQVSRHCPPIHWELIQLHHPPASNNAEKHPLCSSRLARIGGGRLPPPSQEASEAQGPFLRCRYDALLGPESPYLWGNSAQLRCPLQLRQELPLSLPLLHKDYRNSFTFSWWVVLTDALAPFVPLQVCQRDVQCAAGACCALSWWLSALQVCVPLAQEGEVRQTTLTPHPRRGLPTAGHSLVASRGSQPRVWWQDGSQS